MTGETASYKRLSVQSHFAGILPQVQFSKKVIKLTKIHPSLERLKRFDVGDPQAHRRFFDSIAIDLAIKAVGLFSVQIFHPDSLLVQPSDWYNITKRDVLERGGLEILESYDSLGSALSTVYPEHTWHLLKFGSNPLPQGYWRDLSNQREFLQRIAPKIGVLQVCLLFRRISILCKVNIKPEDWYRISRREISDYGGRHLWGYYKGPEDLLPAVFPEHPWDTSRFRKPSRAARGHWNDLTRQRQLVDYVGRALGIKHV